MTTDTLNAPGVDERVQQLNPVTAFLRRLREGQLGILPVIVALIVIVIVFQSINHGFVSPANLVNLSTDVAYVGMSALAINFILLLGEIDLSVAQLGGLAASILGVLMLRHSFDPILSVIIMLAFGVTIGLVQGWFFAVVGIPAFVVTLAGLLAYTGLTLTTLGSQKNLSMSDTFAAKFADYYFPAPVAYLLGVIVVGLFVVGQVAGTIRRRRAGLGHASYLTIGTRGAILAVVIFAFLIAVNYDFGLALPFVAFGVVAVAIDLLLRKTKYGRAIYAVGGNAEAARRAGIRVALVRVSVFMITGLLAAFFGLIKAGVTTNAGSTLVRPEDLLKAIAAAVIGGTSLFGGRGSAWAPVLGALVVGSIYNGLYLIGFNSDAQQIITALVLLAAVLMDALSRRGQRNVGR